MVNVGAYAIHGSWLMKNVSTLGGQLRKNHGETFENTWIYSGIMIKKGLTFTILSERIRKYET